MSAGLMIIVLGSAVVNMPSMPPDVSDCNSVPSVKDTSPNQLRQLQASVQSIKDTLPDQLLQLQASVPSVKGSLPDQLLQPEASVPSVKDTLPDQLLQLPASRSDYTYTPGIGAHKIHTQGATWYEAQRACEEEGGYLAIINSVAESEVIDQLIKNSESHTDTANPYSAYIGVSDLNDDGDWLTIHGESLAVAGFDTWLPGEPNDDGNNAHRVSLFHGKLNDVMCHVTLAYVCELPRGSPQSTAKQNLEVDIPRSV